MKAKKTISARVSEEVDDKLDVYCQFEERSKSWVIEKAIKKFLENRGLNEVPET